jgi:hypothetical protein
MINTHVLNKRGHRVGIGFSVTPYILQKTLQQ